MQRGLPTPVVQAFVVCREIYQDQRTNEFILIRPFNQLTFASFPARYRLAVYTHITGGHGSYRVGFHLRDREDRPVWGIEWMDPLDHPDPLEPQQVVFHSVDVDFPKAGKYELVLVLNGEDTASQGIWARGQ